jgi:hypothetical protein
MHAGRLLHLFVMAVPVAILTTFNILGIKPTAELAGALSAMTTVAAAYATGRALQPRPAPKARPPKKERTDAPVDGKPKSGPHAPARARTRERGGP